MNRKAIFILIGVAVAVGLCLACLACVAAGMLIGGREGAGPTTAHTEAPAATVQVILSGGLGLSEDEWSGDADVTFREGAVWHLEWRFDGEGATLEEARRVGSGLIPLDSVLVETYSPEDMPELIVDLYSSEWLRGQFASDVWIGGEPGEFTVIYGVFDGQVPRVVIGTGNNP